jgi:hypothetical protein
VPGAATACQALEIWEDWVRPLRGYNLGVWGGGNRLILQETDIEVIS